NEQGAVADVGRLREHAGEIDAPLGEPARQVDQEVREPPGVAEDVLGRAASPPPEVPHEVQRAGYGRHGPSMGWMLCNYAPFVHPPSAETQERSTVYAQAPGVVRPRRARPAVVPHPRSVSRARVGVHAAADAGEPGARVLWALPRALPGSGDAGAGQAARGAGGGR